jgi:hypothetical protein
METRILAGQQTTPSMFSSLHNPKCSFKCTGSGRRQQIVTCDKKGFGTAAKPAKKKASAPKQVLHDFVPQCLTLLHRM